jgi:hypothetical protein
MKERSIVSTEQEHCNSRNKDRNNYIMYYPQHYMKIFKTQCNLIFYLSGEYRSGKL